MSDMFNKIVAAAKTSKRLEQQRRNVAFAVHGAHMRDDDVGPARNDFKLPASSAQKLTGALAFKKLGQRQGSLTFDVHEADQPCTGVYWSFPDVQADEYADVQPDEYADV